MNIEPRKGVCRFCGQIRMIEAPESLEQERVDDMATKSCVCEDARDMRAEEDRQQRLREALDRTKNSIHKLFGEDWRQAETFLTEISEAVASGTISKVSIKRADMDTSATLSRKTDGTLRITRKDSEVKVEE